MTKAERLEKIIELTGEFVVGEEMRKTEEYDEIIQENTSIFSEIMQVIERMEDKAVRGNLTCMITEYSESRSRYESFATKYVYQEGAKLGYGIGVSEGRI